MENCKFHLVLVGSSLDQILERLDKNLFTYQIVDCIYTLYKYRFFPHIISSRGEVFNQLNRAVEHNLKYRIPEKLPSVAKKRLLRKKCKNHYLSSAQKRASIQTLGSAFLERFRKVRNSKCETDLLKISDCFIDGYGTVNSERNNFTINNWIFVYQNLVKTNFIWNRRFFQRIVILNTCANFSSDFFHKMHNLIWFFQQVCENLVKFVL